jgi:hypothetical protein
MGEHIRGAYRSFCAAGLRPHVLDVYGLNEPEKPLLAEIKGALTRNLRAVNVFHINGDEVAQTLSRVPLLPDSYNVVYPLWELSRYPAQWAAQLHNFDEIWAPPRFIQQSIAPARVPTGDPHATRVRGAPILLSGKAVFRDPREHVCVSVFFDFRSYASRKNPEAVIECFHRLLSERPYAAAALVVKMNGAGQKPEEAARLADCSLALPAVRS